MSSGETEKPRFYNTLTRQKQDFEPIDPDHVRLYVCGPTVYDYAHIGNARPAIVFDVLYRLLRHLYGEDHVTYVRNITDVDDKINARAARDYPDLPLNEAIRKVTETTAEQYVSDAAALGCLEPTHQPRATENIEQMVAMIGTLIANGNAYAAGGEVLFDTRSMPDYGALSGRDLDEQMAGARITVEEHKRNPGDFVLWKLSDENEPGWDSPWGRGRPGWHLECSAMSERYLWTEMQSELSDSAKAHPHQFDIHGGGLDLIFPHHENEIAQSRCAHGTPGMANLWMHNGFLQVEGRKMSKSEGNFVTINELLETEKFYGRKWPGPVLRLAMLMTRYREPIDFSVARLDEAKRLLGDWMRRAGIPEKGNIDDGVIEALCDDLNFSRARVAIERLVEAARPSGDNPLLQVQAGHDLAATLLFLGLASDDQFNEERRQSEGRREAIEKSMELREYADESVGWREVNSVKERLGEGTLNQRINERLKALAEKDFAKADKIRDDLLTQGVQLMDYKDPDSGERRTKWEIKS